MTTASRILEYMKGNGNEELTVTLNFRQLTDAPSPVPYENAERIAERWLLKVQDLFDGKESGILFLKDWDVRPDRGYRREGRYEFTRESFWKRTPGPVINETWLPLGSRAQYRYHPEHDHPILFSLGDLRFRIRDIGRLVEGPHGSCVRKSLEARSGVRERILGTHLSWGHTSYFVTAPLNQGVAFEAWYDFGGGWVAFERPPIAVPYFSDYWFDGPGKDIYGVYVSDYGGKRRERISPSVYPLPDGDLTFYYGRFLHSLPCDEEETNDRSKGTPWSVTQAMRWDIIQHEPEAVPANGSAGIFSP